MKDILPIPINENLSRSIMDSILFANFSIFPAVLSLIFPVITQFQELM